jgi:hypothetical protein
MSPLLERAQYGIVRKVRDTRFYICLHAFRTQQSSLSFTYDNLMSFFLRPYTLHLYTYIGYNVDADSTVST